MNEIVENNINDKNILELPKSKKKLYIRFAMAALGSVPWVGGFIAATASYQSEKEQGNINEHIQTWMLEHEKKILNLYSTLSSIAKRVNELGIDAEERIQEDSYLDLVKKGFRIWDKTETEEKRELIKKLLINAAGTSVTDDDIVRLFLDWIDRYHESHFGIIRAVYRNPGITLFGIWRELGNNGNIPRENSSSADLFRMLIHDLNTGRVIRQKRDVNQFGQFVKKKRSYSKSLTSNLMKSSFDNVDKHELTELGKDFVHYVLNESISRIEN